MSKNTAPEANGQLNESESNKENISDENEAQKLASKTSEGQIHNSQPTASTIALYLLFSMKTFYAYAKMQIFYASAKMHIFYA